MADAANSGATSVGSRGFTDTSSISASGATSIETNASAHLEEQSSTKTAEAFAVDLSPDFVISSGENIAESGSSSGHDSSPQSDAAHAVGAGADCALIMAIAEDEYVDSDESETVDKLLSTLSKMFTENTSPSQIMPIFNTLGYEGDDKPGTGGANEDSASLDISSITTPHTPPLAREIITGLDIGISDIEETVEEGGEGNTVPQYSNTESGTDEVEIMDDKTDEVSAYGYDQMNEGISANAERDPSRGEVGSILMNAQCTILIRKFWRDV